MELTDGFRKARRNMAALWAISLGWSAAQLEFRSLGLWSAGSVDLSNASIPLIVSFGAVYFMVRCTVEFAMQPIEVRRWKLAQIDYWITLFLFESSLLSLAAGSLYRSVETLGYVLIAVVALLIVSVLLFLMGFFVLTPIMFFIRARQGRHGAVARVQEAEGWSVLIVVVTQVALFVAFGISSLHFEPVMRLWPTPPSATAVIIFVVLTSVVAVSIYSCLFWCSKLFASDIPYSVEEMPVAIMEKPPDG